MNCRHDQALLFCTCHYLCTQRRALAGTQKLCSQGLVPVHTHRTEGVTGSEGRERKNGVGGGIGVGGENGDGNGGGDGDGDGDGDDDEAGTGTGTATGVEANEGAQDGNEDGSGTRRERGRDWGGHTWTSTA